MALAATSQTSVAYVAESTFGTTPATPAFKYIRRTNGNLTTKKGTAVSDEIQADRNVRDELQVSQDVSGSYDVELSYASHDDLLAGALLGSWTTNVLKNGTTGQSFTLEESAVIGGSTAYSRFTGCYVEGFSLNLATKSVVKGSFEIMGKQETLATAAISGATYTAANTNAIETGVSVASLAVGSISPTPQVRSLSLSVKNNLRTRDVLGSLYTLEFGQGIVDVTGTLEAYFESNALYQAVLDHGSGAISFTVGSVTNKKYTFLIPAARFLAGSKRLGGKADDVIVSIPFRGIYDGTTGASLQITRAVA